MESRKQPARSPAHDRWPAKKTGKFLLKQDWEQAVHRGELDQIRHLIRDGADANARDRYGQTALMIAAKNGHTNVVQFLLEQNVELNHTAKYQLSGLMLAVINRHEDIVRMLVKGGADLEIRGTGAPGFHGKTAMDLAVEQGQLELIEALKQS